jgi:hypothetical protein
MRLVKLLAELLRVAERRRSCCDLLNHLPLPAAKTKVEEHDQGSRGQLQVLLLLSKSAQLTTKIE